LGHPHHFGCYFLGRGSNGIPNHPIEKYWIEERHKIVFGMRKAEEKQPWRESVFEALREKK
jgi:hypothetical protein